MLVSAIVYPTTAPDAAEEVSAVLTITREPTSITRVTALVAVWPLASVTRTVKDVLPVVVGVPDSTPVPEASESPAGALPAEMDQVRGATPPVTSNVVV